jgi:hypothetical protein
MWNYDEEDDATAVEVSTDRVVIGTIYLVLVGALLSGVVHLIAG